MTSFPTWKRPLRKNGMPKVRDRYAYVADTINRRVVPVRLAYAAEATVRRPIET